MFKKLKKDMLFLNLGIFVLLLLAIFSSLYISTYTDINRRIDSDLAKLLDIRLLADDANPGPLQPVGDNDTFSTVSVLMQVEDSLITDSFSRLNSDDDFLNELYSFVKGSSGTFESNGYYWRYDSKQFGNKTLIAFVDVTRDTELLNSQIVRYSIIFVVTLVVTAIMNSYITNRSIKPIKESYQKQKEFIANASHELKTPLTVINTNIDVLLSQEVKSENLKWLEYIQTEVKRMNKLTQDLLYLAKVGEAQEVLKTEINLTDKLTSVLLSVEALAFEKNQELAYTLEDNATVKFNEEQLMQVVMVLLDNAIKYTPKMGKIELNLTSSSKHTCIKVKNTGDGMTEDEIKHLFDRFYRVDKSRANAQNSFGLGLSIAKSILDNNHAKISVNSTPGEYTEFTIKIPR